MSYTYPIHIHHIYISPQHNYWGRDMDKPGRAPTRDVAEAELAAGKGLVGNRFFDTSRPDSAVTFFAHEVVQALRDELDLALFDPIVLRRNVVIEGVDLNALRGEEFEIQTGDATVRFRGAGESYPCRWMNAAVAPGAMGWLKGRGGLRAAVLSDGVLRRGMGVLRTSVEIDLSKVVEPMARPVLP